MKRTDCTDGEPAARSAHAGCLTAAWAQTRAPADAAITIRVICALHPLNLCSSLYFLPADSDLTYRIIGLTMRVHSRLGPGLLESITGAFTTSYPVPATSSNNRSSCRFATMASKSKPGYSADIIVHGALIMELKAVEQFNPLHEARLLTYLRLSSGWIGLLINCNAGSLIDGIHRRAF